MTTSAHFAGSVHELLDLALGEIATFDCEVFSVWCAAIGYLIGHGKSLYCKDGWKDNSFFLHSCELDICSLSLFSLKQPRRTGKEKIARNLILDFSFF